MMDLQEAALVTGGTAVGGSVSFRSVSTDSRAIQPEQLFVALRGERFDGHEFVGAVAAQGAVAAMVDRAWAATHPVPLPLLVVEDTRLGLGRLAAGWRSRFDLPLIGVTGSNGKTTVKEMCAAILRAQARIDGFDPDLAVLATRGNLNNDIGVPLMLLRLSGNHRSAVIEMGMNRPGEIGYLTHLAQADRGPGQQRPARPPAGHGQCQRGGTGEGRDLRRPVLGRRGGDQRRRPVCRPTGAQSTVATAS
jgi:UDP-N-acetylmuramoyl-tripeptide--D-alanyl-D-alanine ligase